MIKEKWVEIWDDKENFKLTDIYGLNFLDYELSKKASGKTDAFFVKRCAVKRGDLNKNNQRKDEGNWVPIVQSLPKHVVMSFRY